MFEDLRGQGHCLSGSVESVELGLRLVLGSGFGCGFRIRVMVCLLFDYCSHSTATSYLRIDFTV